MKGPQRLATTRITPRTTLGQKWIYTLPVKIAIAVIAVVSGMTCKRGKGVYSAFYYMALSHKDWELPNSRI